MSSFSDDASMIVINAIHPAMTAIDLRKPGISVRLGSDGPGTTQYLFAVIAKEVLGLNVSVISTYSGSVSIFKDMDAGKLDGQVIGLNSIRASQPALWASKTLRPLVQLGRTTRHPDLADVPAMRELTTDPKALAIVAFAEQPFLMALPFMAPPGVPADRADALRDAFSRMMADNNFLADAKHERLDITPVSGEAVRALIADLAATPKDVIAHFNTITMPKRNQPKGTVEIDSRCKQEDVGP